MQRLIPTSHFSKAKRVVVIRYRTSNPTTLSLKDGNLAPICITRASTATQANQTFASQRSNQQSRSTRFSHRTVIHVETCVAEDTLRYPSPHSQSKPNPTAPTNHANDHQKLFIRLFFFFLRKKKSGRKKTFNLTVPPPSNNPVKSVKPPPPSHLLLPSPSF